MTACPHLDILSHKTKEHVHELSESERLNIKVIDDNDHHIDPRSGRAHANQAPHEAQRARLCTAFHSNIGCVLPCLHQTIPCMSVHQQVLSASNRMVGHLRPLSMRDDNTRLSWVSSCAKQREMNLAQQRGHQECHCVDQQRHHQAHVSMAQAQYLRHRLAAANGSMNLRAIAPPDSSSVQGLVQMFHTLEKERAIVVAENKRLCAEHASNVKVFCVALTTANEATRSAVRAHMGSDAGKYFPAERDLSRSKSSHAQASEQALSIETDARQTSRLNTQCKESDMRSSWPRSQPSRICNCNCNHNYRPTRCSVDQDLGMLPNGHTALDHFDSKAGGPTQPRFPLQDGLYNKQASQVCKVDDKIVPSTSAKAPVSASAPASAGCKARCEERFEVSESDSTSSSEFESESESDFESGSDFGAGRGV